jgi:methyltransferase (TIGR00027 family)
MARTLLGDFRPIAGQILSRARYAEDRLDRAISRGIDQYVIIGAGLDSFALRRPELSATLRVFELDHPATQRAKRHRLGKLMGSPAKNVEFVPIDFEHETISEALSASSFAQERKAFFSWLGTVSYLTEEAVFETLRGLASFAAPGSELVFDYAIPEDLLDAEARRLAAKLKRFTRRRGEPLVTFFDPETFPSKVIRLGYKVLEVLSPPEQDARYFSNRSDGLRTWPGTYYLHVAMDREAGRSPERGMHKRFQAPATSEKESFRQGSREGWANRPPYGRRGWPEPLIDPIAS